MDLGAAQPSAARPCAPTTASRRTSRRGGARGRSSSPGTPFERLLSRAPHRGRAGRGGRRHRGHADRRAARARHGALGGLHGAPRRPRARSTRRSPALEAVRSMSREQVFWGWGEPGSRPALPEHADAFLREALGVPGGVVEAPVALEDVRLRPTRRCPEALRRAAGGDRRRGRCATTARSRVLRCRGKSYLDLLAQRAGRLRVGARRRRAPARATSRCRRVLRAVRRGRRGGGAVRRRHQRRRRPGGRRARASRR